MQSKFTAPCVICKKVHQMSDTSKYVYHQSKGIVCLRHPGVEKWYNEMLEAADKEVEAATQNDS